MSDYSEYGLKEVYAEQFLVGVALNSDQAMGDNSMAQALIRKNFNSVTSENDMKWEVIHPEPGVYDFTTADSLVSRAESLNIKVIGHTLLWHSQTPDWVFEDEEGGPASRDQLLERLREHIQTVVGRYRGRIHGWDVVNEALNEDGSLRDSPWLRIIGPDYLEKAFTFARETDPQAELYYNDYNLCSRDKGQAAIELLKGLRSAGCRIDAIGIQGHFALEYTDLAEFESCVESFAAEGFKVMVSELDISVLPFPDSENIGADVAMRFDLKKEFDPFADGLPPEVEREHIELYAGLFEILKRHSEHVSRVTLWGLSDGNSWRNNWPMSGRTDYPLLWDRAYQPKPALNAVIQVGTR